MIVFITKVIINRCFLKILLTNYLQLNFERKSFTNTIYKLLAQHFNYRLI